MLVISLISCSHWQSFYHCLGMIKMGKSTNHYLNMHCYLDNGTYVEIISTVGICIALNCGD